MSNSSAALFAFLAIAAGLITGNSSLRLSREYGYYCNEEAMNPYAQDCHKYVICVRNTDGSFSGDVAECPAGEAFSMNDKACVPEDEVTNCRTRIARDTTGGGNSNDSQTPATKDCNNKAISCADCNNLRICSFTSTGFTFMSDVQCTDGKKNTYCDSDTGTCTDKAPEKCDSGQTCTGSGYFPDASDCTKYHICYEEAAGKLKAATQYCDAAQVYSSTQKICVNRVRPTDCHVASCPINKTMLTSFPGEPSYYVVCVLGKPDFVYYCGDNKEFNAAKSECEVKCKQAGRIPESGNCDGYYECTPNRIGGGFTVTSKKCPTGTKFNADTGTCVPGTCP